MEIGNGELAAIAAAHGFSEAAATELLGAMRASHGAMAQFSHPELGGMGQWSRGGMLMIGDMFNNGLKARVAALADDLSRNFGETDDAGSLRRNSDGGLAPMRRHDAGRWWPEELGIPAAAGAQNGIRYAVFPDTQRVAVERDGEVSIRDTGENRISGVSQQQGSATSLRFTGNRGTVDLSDLPEV